METRAFDAITRRAALLTLATLVPAVNVDARKRNKNTKRNKGNANQLCKKQAGQCTATLAPLVEEGEISEETLACCSFLGTCNANGFLACVAEAAQQT